MANNLTKVARKSVREVAWSLGDAFIWSDVGGHRVFECLQSLLLALADGYDVDCERWMREGLEMGAEPTPVVTELSALRDRINKLKEAGE